MNKKNNSKIIAAIFIAAIIVLSSILVYIAVDNNDKKEEKKQEEEKEIDNRISPFRNLGLTVEILRIRNRGLMEKMLTFGTSWRSPPTFFYIAEVDGKIGDTAEIEAAGGVAGEGTFTEWDTIGKECRVKFDTDDEQLTSKVTIKIMELQKTGFLGRKQTRVEKEKIDLVYDYRTGHWSKDDFLGDEDGYGHYLGEEYEVWFNIYQSDFDHDGIPFWTEVNVYGSNPQLDDSESDPDGDGIPSSWEWKYGYDPNTYDNHRILDPDVDGLNNIEEYETSRWFSDPFSPDIFIETDGMKKNPNSFFDWEHVFYKESQQMVIERFAQHGINVYIDDGWADGPVNGGGEMLDFVETLDEVVGGHMARWYKHNFNDERKEVFRYVIVGNNAGFITPSKNNHYDHVVVDSSLYKTYFKRYAFTPRWQRVVLAKGVLHELGHSLGLMPITFAGVDSMPGGNARWPTKLTDEEYQEINTNYESVMNYNYIFSVFKNRNLFDFSDGSNGETSDFDDWAHIYVPFFQTDDMSYEEPEDETFEDYYANDKEPEPGYGEWLYHENLTKKYLDQIERFNLVKNTDSALRIYIREENKNLKGNNMEFRVYLKPNIKPVPALWTLVAEGKLDTKENSLKFYSYEDEVYNVLSMIE